MNQDGGKRKRKIVIGSPAQVMHGTADRTSGGLGRDDFEYNKRGKIVSKKRSAAAKRNKNLGDCLVKKGSKGFKLVKKGCVKKTQKRKSRSKSRSRSKSAKRRRR